MAPPSAITLPLPSSNTPSPAVLEQFTDPNGLYGLFAGTQSFHCGPLFGVSTPEFDAKEASGASL